jgi:hypothetical protein
LTSPTPVLCGSGVSIIRNPVLERNLKTLHDSASLSEKVRFLLLLLYLLLVRDVSCVCACVQASCCVYVQSASSRAQWLKRMEAKLQQEVCLLCCACVFAPLACEQVGRIQLGNALPARSQ